MKNNEGSTIFQATGIKTDYTHVDLLKKRVTATISYQDEIKMTVITDFITGQMHKEGDLTEILTAWPGDDPQSYFDEIYEWSKTFIENDISDPQRYFEQFQ
ncbi:hypothetical protein G159_04355 [Planococcus glaciei CHR43]|uniref:hypothetical protein n=1 Tax=Planococcus glaciei TaxID=459472 RepID=UPI0003DF0C01|nr:hypothetical protein [Planococcus glaciei]ETP69939.1 hypothetical protein G159_04355 [Planococcus glaciei CHR43]